MPRSHFCCAVLKSANNWQQAAFDGCAQSSAVADCQADLSDKGPVKLLKLLKLCSSATVEVPVKCQAEPCFMHVLRKANKRESTVANANSSLTVLSLLLNCSANDVECCIHKAIRKTLSLDGMLQHP